MTEKHDHALLISDLHLEAGRPDITQAFLSFLEQHGRLARELYILGDFFNFWIGDDHHSELGSLVAEALKETAESGTAVFLMHGNRDFLMGREFAAHCGASLISEPYLLPHANGNILLLHGDSLCTMDHDYMQFRAMVRNPEWQAAFLARPLAERFAIAQQARQQSKSMSSNKAADIMDVTQDALEELMRSTGVTTLIHGHTHRPAVHEFMLDGKPAQRYVLGDWDQTPRYTRITADSVELLHFPLA